MADRLERLRAQLPAVLATAYFNAGTNGPIPLAAHQALLAAAEREVQAGRIAPGTYAQSFERYGRVRGLVAGMMGADAAEIALTHSTTEGINIALLGLHWRRGDEIVTTRLEHQGLLAPLCLLAHRFGVRLRSPEIGNGGGDVAAAIAGELTPRTRVIALSHVMWSSGAVMPLAEISALARRRDVLVVVDGAQAAGQIPVDLHASGVDAYALSGQKWLCGPEGTGALYIRRDRLGLFQPTFIRYGRIDPDGYLLPAAGAARYEGGEFFGPGLAAQEAALGFLRDDVGLDWLLDRTAALGRRSRDGLAAIPGVTVTTPRERMGGIVCFQVDCFPPSEIVAALARHNITIRAVEAPPCPRIARVSNAWWNTEGEVDALVAAVAEIVAGARA